MFAVAEVPVAVNGIMGPDDVDEKEDEEGPASPKTKVES